MNDSVDFRYSKVHELGGHSKFHGTSLKFHIRYALPRAWHYYSTPQAAPYIHNTKASALGQSGYDVTVDWILSFFILQLAHSILTVWKACKHVLHNTNSISSMLECFYWCISCEP